MTELKTFLVAVYDSLSEAEIEAFVHGKERMTELAEEGDLPEDVSVPVYHATDMNISLDVGLEVERTETGQEVYITQPPPDEESRMTFSVDVFDLVETQDITEVDPEDVIDDLPTRHSRGSDDRTGGSAREKKSSREDTDTDTDTDAETDTEDADEPDEPNDSNHRPDGESAPTESGIPRVSTEKSIAAIDTIEASTAKILENSGIETVAELLTRTPQEIAETVGDAVESVSTDRAATWRRDARAAVKSEAARERDRPIEDIEGIGPTYGERLRETGIETFGDLADRSPEAVAEHVSTESVTVTPRRAEHWIEEAEGRIADAENGPSDNGEDTT